MINDKYQLLKDDTKKTKDGITVYRIKALKDIGDKVRAGDLGGYIQSEANLSTSGECWVAENAVVSENAIVNGNALVSGNAVVTGYAWVIQKSVVTGNAIISGNAVVCGFAEVSGNAMVKGRDLVVVSGDDVVTDNTVISK